MARHSSLGAFGKDMQRRASRLDKEVTRALVETAISVVTHVSRATPILTGQAQSNWLTRIGSPHQFYVANENANSGWTDSVDFARTALRGANAASVIHITNNVPYIVQLNRGTSKQAPALFVQTAVVVAAYQLKAFRIKWT